MSDWRPIETAPKDGAVLLYTPQHGAEFGYWYRDRWVAENNGDYHEGGYGHPYPRDPTRWMPLPDPPEASDAR